MAVNIVLVHYHRKIFPDYIYTCLEQIRDSNPTAKVYLGYFSSSNADKERLISLGCELVDIGGYIWSLMHYLFKIKNRGVFTTERFFVLYEIMKQKKLKNVIHIENDVLVYMDINRIFPILEQEYNLGVVRVTDDLCVASFVYIKDRKCLRELCTFFLKEKNVNDMSALSKYCRKNCIKHLPVVSKSYVQNEDMDYGQPDNRKKVGNKDIYCNNIDKFNCIFDGSAYGMYVGGLDVRFGLGDTRGYVNEVDSCYDLRRCTVIWKIINGHKSPFYSYMGEEIPIVNLHIYSKELDQYSWKTLDKEIVERDNS